VTIYSQYTHLARNAVLWHAPKKIFKLIGVGKLWRQEMEA